MKMLAMVLLAAVTCAAVGVCDVRAVPGLESKQGARHDAAHDDDTVDLDATLVEVPVVVSEPGGRYVVDLQQSDFKVFENGKPQEISFFAAVDEPFNVALVLDCSGSTREKLDRMKAAATSFLDALRPADRVSVVTLDDEVRVLAPMTSDRDRLRAAIARIQPGQFTQVYEAMHVVASEVLGPVEGRKAAIFFTDGVDSASALSGFDDTLDEVAQGQIIVYPIRYDTRGDVEVRQGIAKPDSAEAPPPLPEGARPRRATEEQTRKALADAYHIADAYLYELAQRSGGVLLRADSIGDLSPALARIADELRHQYMLGYYPPKTPEADDAARAITVTVSRPGVTIRSRRTYRPFAQQPRPR